MLKSERVLISEGIDVTPPSGSRPCTLARTVRTRSEPESERKWARARLVVLLSVFMTRLFADIMSTRPFGPLALERKNGCLFASKRDCSAMGAYS